MSHSPCQENTVQVSEQSMTVKRYNKKFLAASSLATLVSCRLPVKVCKKLAFVYIATTTRLDGVSFNHHTYTLPDLWTTGDGACAGWIPEMDQYGDKAQHASYLAWHAAELATLEGDPMEVPS